MPLAGFLSLWEAVKAHERKFPGQFHLKLHHISPQRKKKLICKLFKFV